ncbi:MAG: HNH endonuclease [Myxococcota bacterium]
MVEKVEKPGLSELVHWGRRIQEVKGSHELDWKLRGFGRLAEARNALLEGRPEWVDLMQRTLQAKPTSKAGGLSGLLNWLLVARFTEWVDGNPDEARDLCTKLWGPEPWPAVAAEGANKLLPVANGVGSRVALSTALACAVDTRNRFPYAEMFFRKALSVSGYVVPSRDASPLHWLQTAQHFLEDVREEGIRQGAEVPDLLSAHAIAWYSVKYDDPSLLPELEWTKHRRFLGKALSLYEEAQSVFAEEEETVPEHEQLHEDLAYGLRAVLLRRGQASFRKALLEAYRGRCAITGCDAEDALEAAHVRAYGQGGESVVQNGILMRADLHTLFDVGLLSIDSRDWVVQIHPKLRDGHYADLHGAALRLPDDSSYAPSAEALRNHLAQCGWS